MVKDSAFAHDPRHIVKSYFDDAKRNWGWSLALKALAPMISLYATFAATETTTIVPMAVLILAGMSEFLQWRSDFFRGQAESLKRKIEYFDGFGWPLSPTDLTDCLVRISKKKRDSIEKAVRESYFSSKAPHGAQRVLENLQESTWWSKHLSASMLWRCSITAAVMTIGAVIALIGSTSTINDVSKLHGVNRIVTAVLGLVTSLGMLKLLVSYFTFNKKAELTERQATALLQSGQPPEQVAVLRLLHEYQIARSAAAPIPDWVYNSQRAELNELWSKYQASPPEPTAP